MTAPSLPTIFDAIQAVAPNYNNLLAEEKIPRPVSEPDRKFGRVIHAHPHFGAEENHLWLKRPQQDCIEILRDKIALNQGFEIHWQFSTSLVVLYDDPDQLVLTLDQCLTILQELSDKQETFLINEKWIFRDMKEAMNPSAVIAFRQVRDSRDRFRDLISTHFGSDSLL